MRFIRPLFNRLRFVVAAGLVRVEAARIGIPDDVKALIVQRFGVHLAKVRDEPTEREDVTEYLGDAKRRGEERAGEPLRWHLESGTWVGRRYDDAHRERLDRMKG